MSSQKKGLQTAGRQEHGWERVRERRHQQGDVGKREKPLLGTQDGTQLTGQTLIALVPGLFLLSKRARKKQGTST